MVSLTAEDCLMKGIMPEMNCQVHSYYLCDRYELDLLRQVKTETTSLKQYSSLFISFRATQDFVYLK